ncbi:MAG: uncharacterized membrane protein YhaH (DUF805 family) [Shewanella sp.]|jgi:uncharacterized membrane protein YhaH (DUF805 family)
MQYKSLFCVKGRDNGLRFSVISGVLYLVLLLGFMLTGVGGGNVLLAVLLMPVLGLSALRRVHDTERKSWFAAIPVLPFMLVSLSLAGGSVAASLISLVIGASITLFLALQKSPKSASSYHQGYFGPLAAPQRARNHSRVEPTLGGSASQTEEASAYGEEYAERSYQEPRTTGRPEAGVTFELWRTWAKQNQTLLFGVAGTCLLLMVLSSLWSMLDSSEDAPEQASIEHAPQESVARSEVRLPDGFSLLLEDDLLIMRWLGEADVPGVIWSLATAKGDNSCAELVFNDGSQYRPQSVELMADSSIEARFTPLDTAKIINDIALRGSIKLCGYKFSLKGSQSALAKSGAFVPYLT